MGWIEFAFIIVGAVILIISFAIPAGKAGKNAAPALKIDDGMMKELVEREIGNARSHMNEMVEETLNYSMEKSERAMERMTNEKIMAINEYSEQVLAAINKNHQEVMFLYDMLNDKHTNLVNTVSEASQKAKEIRQTVQDAEITVKEAVGMIDGEAESMPDGGEKADRSDAAERDRKGSEAADILGSVTDGSMQGGQTEEFIPISAKRVELVQNVIKAKEQDGAEDDAETDLDTDEEKVYNNNERILRLYKLGKSKTAIARELGLGIGEVKLVIDLFKQ